MMSLAIVFWMYVILFAIIGGMRGWAKEILVSFSVTTGDYAYISLPRHLLLALPVFIGLAAALKKGWQRKTLIAIQIVGAMFLLVLYVFIQLIP